MSVFTTPTTDDPVERLELNAFRFSLGSSILFGLVLILTFIINGSFTVEPAGSVTLGICVIASIISVVLNRRGKSTQGVLIMIGSLILLTMTRVFISKGLAIPTGMINVVVVTTIAVFSLPAIWRGRVIALAFANAAISILIDQYTTGIPATNNPQIAIILSLVIGAIYLAILLIQFPKFSLRAKLIIGFIFLTILPIILLSAQSYLATRNLLKEQIRSEILRTAITINTAVEAYAESQFSAMRTQARAAEILDYLNLSPSARRGSETERLAAAKLKTFRTGTSTVVRSFSILDLNGVSILDSNQEFLGKDYSNEYFFQYVATSGKSYASRIYALTDGDYVIYFAGPIFSRENKLIGVFLRTYDAKAVQLILTEYNRINRIPGRITEYSYVMDGTNFFVLGHTTRLDLIYTTYLSQDDPRIPALIEQSLIGQNNFESRFISQPETVKSLTEMENTASFLLPSPAFQNELSETAATRVANTDWIVLTSEPDSLISTLIQGQTRVTVISGIILVSLAAILGLLAASFFTNPIIELTRVAEGVSSGDFTRRAEIRTKDEIGLLANAFNLMTNEIQQLISKLESRVEERTSALSEASLQSEKRAQNLQTIAEISRTISTEKNQDKLLALIATIVSARFGFYHVGIFLLDLRKEYAVLVASNSEGGRKMLSRNHRLPVNDSSIVGSAGKSGSPHLALDTKVDSTFSTNPDLSLTQSEIALPLIVDNEVIGVLDVQSTDKNAISEDDITVMSTLAGQISIAIQNARSDQQTREALKQAEKASMELSSQNWRQFTSQKQIESVVFDGVNTKSVSSTNGKNPYNLAIPLVLRGTKIGSIKLNSIDPMRVWTDDEIAVLQAAADRTTLAIENARLLQEAQKRAVKERTIGQISSKIGGLVNIENILETAIKELGGTMPNTDITIQFSQEDSE